LLRSGTSHKDIEELNSDSNKDTVVIEADVFGDADIGSESENEDYFEKLKEPSDNTSVAKQKPLV
jgi:hypothetical protein